MVKDAAPPGQIGKVFGFVSAGLPLGQALTPVPFGFLIDMGRPVRLSQVEVQFGTDGSTTAEIYLGNSNALSKTALNNFTRVAPAATASGDHVYTINSSATGRYVLIWLTGDLPPMPGSPGQYQARIYNVVVRGSAVANSG